MFGPRCYKENDENEKLRYMYSYKENVYKYINPFTPKSATYRFYCLTPDDFTRQWGTPRE